MTHIVEHMAELVGARDPESLDRCFIDLFTELLSAQSARVMHCHDTELRDWQVRSPPPPSGHPIYQPSAQRVKHYQDCLHQGQILSLEGHPSITLVPLNTTGDTTTLVELSTAEPLSEDNARSLQAIQRFIQHFQALLDENERDSLTRLLNRKSFDETFVRTAMEMAEIELECELNDQPLPSQGCWLGVIDIDHFKRVNDNFGHLIGDEVLILIAQIMKQSFRATDRLYRFGGEEFVVLLRTSSSGDAAQAFERLRQNIEMFTFPRVEHLTVSIGFTRITSYDTPSAAFERADRGVYHAKDHGRNQSICYEQLITQGNFLSEETQDSAGEIEFF